MRYAPSLFLCLSFSPSQTICIAAVYCVHRVTCFANYGELSPFCFAAKYIHFQSVLTRDGAKKERFFLTSGERRVHGLDARCHFRLIRHSRSRNSGEASSSRYLSIRGEKNFVKKLSLISRLRVFPRELLIISAYYTFYLQKFEDNNWRGLFNGYSIASPVLN